MADVADLADDGSALGLTSIEARVLGAMLEKELTTPDAYPLTLNALTTACNQSSNRDPVVSFTTREVEATVLALKAKRLARVVHPGSGVRATKYRQVLDEAIELSPAERAVLCVLLLRGAQTVAELKARTERLHGFASPEDVERTLGGLAARTPALVTRLERAPGQKEARWLQLLERDVEGRRATAPAPPARVAAGTGGPGRIEELEARVATLEGRLAALVEALGDLVDLSTGADERPELPSGAGPGPGARPTCSGR
jgi:uncharacterized protein YceH (UPF0502 family)